MRGPEFPLALGVIRDTEAPVYDEEVYTQFEEIKPKRNCKSLNEFFMSLDTWEIK